MSDEDAPDGAGAEAEAGADGAAGPAKKRKRSKVERADDDVKAHEKKIQGLQEKLEKKEEELKQAKGIQTTFTKQAAAEKAEEKLKDAQKLLPLLEEAARAALNAHTEKESLKRAQEEEKAKKAAEGAPMSTKAILILIDLKIGDFEPEFRNSSDKGESVWVKLQETYLLKIKTAKLPDTDKREPKSLCSKFHAELNFYRARGMHLQRALEKGTGTSADAKDAIKMRHYR
jgi:hypothetical protein